MTLLQLHQQADSQTSGAELSISASELLLSPAELSISAGEADVPPPEMPLDVSRRVRQSGYGTRFTFTEASVEVGPAAKSSQVKPTQVKPTRAPPGGSEGGEGERVRHVHMRSGTSCITLRRPIHLRATSVKVSVNASVKGASSTPSCEGLRLHPGGSYMRACRQAGVQACRRAGRQAHIHAHMHSHMHSHMHACITSCSSPAYACRRRHRAHRSRGTGYRVQGVHRLVGPSPTLLTAAGALERP